MNDLSSSSSLERNTRKSKKDYWKRANNLPSSQLEQLESEKKDINAIKGNVNKHSSDKKPTKMKCNNCNREHPLRPRDRCPAYRSRCMNCYKDIHWAKVCCSYPQGMTTTRGRHRNRANSRPRLLSTRRDRRSRRSASRNCRDEDERKLSDQFETITFESITVGAITPRNPSEDEVFVTIGIDLRKLSNGPATLKAKLDKGAQGNILPLRLYL